MRIRDFLPFLPNKSTVRDNLPLKDQRFAIGEEEYVDFALELADVTVKYPSGYVETVDIDTFDPNLLRVRFGIEEKDWQERRKIMSYLLDYKRVIYFPNSKKTKLVIHDPQGREILI